MSSETLDKLFRGQIDGESAYLSGEIRLRGDEWVAEAVASYIQYIESVQRRCRVMSRRATLRPAGPVA